MEKAMTPMLNMQVAIWLAATTVTEWIDDTASRRMHDDRGEVSSTTILVAIFCAIAIAVGGILYTKFVGKANSIQTGP
jgi:hypothetical protein